MTLRKAIIVEDDENLRVELQIELETADQFSVIGAARNYAEAIEFMRSDYDVLLVDLGLPDGNGADLILRARHAGFKGPAMVLTSMGDEPTVIKALEAGADGYLLKAGYPGQIAEQLNRLIGGEPIISPSIARILIKRVQAEAVPQVNPNLKKSFKQDHEEVGRFHLAPRELEVLQLLAKGRSYKQVSTDLGLAYNTVAHYVKQIYTKLAVSSRSEAIYHAVSRGIIEL